MTTIIKMSEVNCNEDLEIIYVDQAISRRLSNANSSVDDQSQKADRNKMAVDQHEEKRRSVRKRKEPKHFEVEAMKTTVPKKWQSSYEVETIVNHSDESNGQKLFLIKWLNYGHKDNTWEPESNLDCPIKLREYWKRVKRSLEASELSTPIPFGSSRQKQLLNEWEEDMNRKSRQAGEARLFLVNNVDEAVCPENFEYGTEFRPIGQASNVNLYPKPLLSCQCDKNDCLKSNNCCPEKNDAAKQYRRDGKLLKRSDCMTAIYECNSGCKCGPDCENRVVQKGRRVVLRIYRTINSGWGVQAVSSIAANTFVTVYVGQIMTTQEAKERKGKYMFDMDADGQPMFTVDNEYYGNVARFFNHSCQPNMAVRSVYIDCIDAKLPRLALFTTASVAKGEELTFDYANGRQLTDSKDFSDESDEDEQDPGLQDCHCGAVSCRGKLIF